MALVHIFHVLHCDVLHIPNTCFYPYTDIYSSKNIPTPRKSIFKIGICMAKDKKEEYEDCHSSKVHFMEIGSSIVRFYTSDIPVYGLNYINTN